MENRKSAESSRESRFDGRKAGGWEDHGNAEEHEGTDDVFKREDEVENLEIDIENPGIECEENDDMYDSEEGLDVYHSFDAVKMWLSEWFRQKPLKGWTLDNYDGRGSYEELHLEVDERHVIKQRLEPKLFQKMRATLVIIEGEMDEVRIDYRQAPGKAKAKELHDLAKVALSIFDD